MKRILAVLPLGAALLLGSLAFAGEHAGQRAPGFSLIEVLTMRYHDLYDYRGKVVIIDFMKTSCPECQRFEATKGRILKRFGGRVVFLNILMPPDTQNTVSSYAKSFSVENPILYDCGQVTASYERATPEKATVVFPHIFVVDQEGMIFDDYIYSTDTLDIFEGEGLFPILDKLLAANKAI